jgi:hypothetical protein
MASTSSGSAQQIIPYRSILAYAMTADYRRQVQAPCVFYVGLLVVQHYEHFHLKLKLNYDRQSVGQSVSVSDTHLGPVTSISFFSKFSLDSCGFVLL